MVTWFRAQFQLKWHEFQTQTGGEQRERDGCPVQERDGQGGEGAPHPRPPPQAAAGQSEMMFFGCFFIGMYQEGDPLCICDMRSSPVLGTLGVTVTTYCQSRMVEHPHLFTNVMGHPVLWVSDVFSPIASQYSSRPRICCQNRETRETHLFLESDVRTRVPVNYVLQGYSYGLIHGLGGLRFRKFPQLVGLFCIFLLPKQ